MSDRTFIYLQLALVWLFASGPALDHTDYRGIIAGGMVLLVAFANRPTTPAPASPHERHA